ncbi:MAG: MFS transporter [Chitinophagales bacterium]|nr:MFS transporter [Chitinophagales bacterium]
MSILVDDKRTIRSWAMYDWANSVYSLVIASAIFPAYYNTITAATGHSTIFFLGIEFANTALYSICLGLAFGTIAILSPILGSIADAYGKHKFFMKIFCYIGGLSCCSLFFFKGYNVSFGLLSLYLATIGYSGSIVFYNSYLPSIASPEKQDSVSAKGFSYGYIGSTILLLLNLLLILNQEALNVKDDTLLPRLAFLITGIWWLGFAQIPFIKLPDAVFKPIAKTGTNILLSGYSELRKVILSIHDQKVLRVFLLGFFFSIMGVQTVMFMAASFGENEINLNLTQLIITILIVENIGIVGAYLFAFLSQKFGNIKALILAILIWVIICFGAYYIETPVHFYFAGFFIGLVMGGFQCLARSTYSKLIPKTKNDAAYFSFYDVAEKSAMMLGLVMFGYLNQLTGSMRNSIVAVAIWFSIGLIAMILLQKMKPLLKQES